MKEWELFEQFLISNSAYDKFIDGLLNCKSINYLMPFTDLIVYNFTGRAFVWGETKEGFSFWSDLNKEWYDLTKILDIERNKIKLPHPINDRPKDINETT